MTATWGLAFMSFSFGEMALVGLVGLLVFGGRLPEVMRSAGRAYAKLRRGMDELANPIRHEMRKLDDQASLTRRPAVGNPESPKSLPPLATEPPVGIYPTVESLEATPFPTNPDPDGDPDSLSDSPAESPPTTPTTPANAPAPSPRPPVDDRGTAADEPPPV